MYLNFNNSLTSRVSALIKIVKFKVKINQELFQTHIKHDTNTFCQTNIYPLYRNFLKSNHS